jgi:hypothetical protein
MIPLAFSVLAFSCVLGLFRYRVLLKTPQKSQKMFDKGSGWPHSLRNDPIP